MKIHTDVQCLVCQNKFNKSFAITLVGDIEDKFTRKVKCPKCKETDNYMFQINDIYKVDKNAKKI